MNLKLAPLAVLAALAAAPAFAQTLSPEDFIHRHMDFAAKGDADAIANDFAVDGASINGGNAAVGRDDHGRDHRQANATHLNSPHSPLSLGAQASPLQGADAATSTVVAADRRRPRYRRPGPESCHGEPGRCPSPSARRHWPAR